MRYYILVQVRFKGKGLAQKASEFLRYFHFKSEVQKRTSLFNRQTILVPIC